MHLPAPAACALSSRYRAYTLVELLVALGLLAVLGLVAGRLLTGALRSAEREVASAADSTALLRVVDSLKQDLQAQVLPGNLLEPDNAGWSLDGPADKASFFIAGEGGAVNAVSYLAVRGDAPGVFGLWRVRSGTAETVEALPGNAASQAIMDAFDQAEGEGGQPMADQLPSGAELQELPGRFYHISLDYDPAGNAHLLLRWARSSGLRSVSDGKSIKALGDEQVGAYAVVFLKR